MSANFFDTLRYANTGIATADMNAYDKLRAQAMAGGYPLATITGVPPLTFRADGRPLTAWSMLGNGQQTETPTPDATIMPEFVGVNESRNWKIPITCAGQTVPVYLGQVPTVRRIRKLVLDGTENWVIISVSDGRYSYAAINIGDVRTILVGGIGMCSHFKYDNITTQTTVDGFSAINSTSTGYDRLAIRYKEKMAQNDPNLHSFKQWLSQQYSAGTPVVIWYVLAEPETAIVDEPICKIGDYADELHSEDTGVIIPTTRGQNALTVGTDLQPSSVSIAGHIK